MLGAVDLKLPANTLGRDGLQYRYVIRRRETRVKTVMRGVQHHTKGTVSSKLSRYADAYS
jgi:hypothetical protein